MAASTAETEPGQGTATTDTDSGPSSLFGNRDHCLARERYPRLYCQIMYEHVSFDHIAKAWRISHDLANPVGKEEQRVSQLLEYEARRKFSAEHGDIEREYWTPEPWEPWAGCALTGDSYVHSVMNITEPELVLYEDRVHQLCRDAHRTFEEAARRSEKANKDLKEIGEMLYVVLTRVILAASVLEDEHATPHERDQALAALGIEWKTAHVSVEEMIQRQARFEYFEGVGLSALITIPALAAAGWAAVHYGLNQLSEPGQPGSFTAAVIGGAAGAVISVTQRMTTKTRTPLVIDFTAPKWQKMVLGMLRPIVGAVFGAVAYFAIVGGLLAVQAKNGQDATVALAFFAVVGFAAGFSERFATDVLNRASILPTTRDKDDMEESDEPSVLLSEQPHHAQTPAVTQERQATTPQRRPRRRPHRFLQRSAK
jgi:hypothetical protein